MFPCLVGAILAKPASVHLFLGQLVHVSPPLGQSTDPTQQHVVSEHCQCLCASLAAWAGGTVLMSTSASPPCGLSAARQSGVTRGVRTVLPKPTTESIRWRCVSEASFRAQPSERERLCPLVGQCGLRKLAWGAPCGRGAKQGLDHLRCARDPCGVCMRTHFAQPLNPDVDCMWVHAHVTSQPAQTKNHE
jgi:hypothetical protein